MSDETPAEGQARPIVVNADDAELHEHLVGDHWGGSYKVLTPGLRELGGARVGVNQTRVPPGRSCVPFHWHQREDEVFFIQSGRGVLRYGDTLTPLKAGDCITCPAGTKVAHQIANPFDEELVYLAIGNHDPDEVCGYPDTGKVMVRSVKTVGFLEGTAYMKGEPDRPKVFDLIETSKDG